MTEIGKKWVGFRTVIFSKWTARVVSLVFLGLAIFFAFPTAGYRSLFRQTLFYFGISIFSATYAATYDWIRNLAFVFCLGSGLLLIAFFFSKARHGFWKYEIGAINCAWMAFVLEASLALGLQWEALDVWVLMNNTVAVFFFGTILLSAASVFLLTPYLWMRRFGCLVSWIVFLGNLFGLAWMLRYWFFYSDPFPILACIALVTTSLSICALHANQISRSHWTSLSELSEGKNMRLKALISSSKVTGIILASVLFLGSFVFFQPYKPGIAARNEAGEFYSGVAFCGNTTLEATRLIDRVKNFTNIFVVQSLPISYDEATLNDICDHAVASGLSIIVYFRLFDQYWQIHWLDFAEARWGERFLGVYLYDEPGGLQLDFADQIGIPPPGRVKTYADATKWFIDGVWAYRGRADLRMLKMRAIKAYVSDYALYWFDYMAGYDTVFAQFGWNHSRQMHIALCRGAANLHNKDWGAVITWTYREKPYLESGEEMYQDAVLAYDAGAKYVLVFDYPYDSDSTFGILEEEHLEAMSRFWEYAKQNPRPNEADRLAAYVLPRDYGYGFRGPDDVIWGRFEADELSNRVWGDLNRLLGQFGTRLDVIYEDGLQSNSEATKLYDELFFWNHNE